jgi:hypothetical protein
VAQVIHKASALEAVESRRISAIDKYADFFVGRRSLLALIEYELCTTIPSIFPGALGYLARKLLYKRILGQCGRGVQFGRNVALRHAAKMHIGDGTAVDDDCLLDARGTVDGGFVIGQRESLFGSVQVRCGNARDRR